MTTTTTLSLDDAIRRLRHNDPQLTKLQLEGCEFTRLVDRRNLKSGLRKTTYLHELSLSRNQLSTWPTDQLYKLLESIACCTSLKKVKIAQNDLDADAVEHLVRAILKNKANTLLESLDLSFNRLGDAGARHLSTLFKSIDLKELILSGTKVGNDGTVALGRALSGSQLRVLNLRENQVGAKGCQAIAQALPHSHLEELILHFNTIKDDGAIALGRALSVESTSLRVLHLRQNQINIQGGLALARSLFSNTTLQELDLSFQNCIEVPSIECMTDALKHENVTLSELCLWNRYRQDSVELQHYVSLNRMGRQHLGDTNIPAGAWPLALARVSNDVPLLFHFLKSRPDMLKK
jgi:Ran GTPase-activating protein (RanGAP) involved in mRNA processing and transport